MEHISASVFLTGYTPNPIETGSYIVPATTGKQEVRTILITKTGLSRTFTRFLQKPSRADIEKVTETLCRFHPQRLNPAEAVNLVDAAFDRFLESERSKGTELKSHHWFALFSVSLNVSAITKKGLK